MIRYKFNSSRITEVANVTNNNKSGRNNDSSIITYYHLGKPLWLGYSDIKYIIKKFWVAWKHYGCILQLDLFNIQIGSRRLIWNTSRKKEKCHWGAYSIDIDNHVDTHCFWKKHTANIIYIRRLYVCIFPSGLFWTCKYPNIYRSNLIYNGIGKVHNTYTWPRLMVWQQDGEVFNKPQSMTRFWHTKLWQPYQSAQATGNWGIS